MTENSLRAAAVVLRGLVVGLLAGGLAASPVLAAPGVQLTIRDGRVWLTAERATIGQILAEWERVGGTHIVNGERVPGGPQTLALDGVTEQEALDVLLRSAGGFVAVARTVGPGGDEASASHFSRVVVAGGTQSASLNTRPAPASPPATFAPQSSPVQPGVASAGGGMRIIGPDGQPVPDDQDENTPRPINGSMPPGFSPQPEAPPTVQRPATPAGWPTIPPGVSTPGMMPPPARQPGAPAVLPPRKPS